VSVVDAVGRPEDAVAEAVVALRAGRPVVLPTETVYGVAALPGDPGAVEELFERKGRPGERLLAVLVADLAVARRIAVVDAMFETLAASFWPGPLTIVAQRLPEIDLHLGDGSSTVGVRCPDHDLVRAILAEVGPMATTSANLSGQPTPTTALQAAEALGGDLLVLDGGRCTGSPSTVVDLTTNPARVLRTGAVTRGSLLGVGLELGPDGAAADR
jgi:tRNA threonylcarbamoyl adenosine modification protein (Sua5/YciO/YrdC/YwlC family)